MLPFLQVRSVGWKLLLVSLPRAAGFSSPARRRGGRSSVSPNEATIGFAFATIQAFTQREFDPWGCPEDFPRSKPMNEQGAGNTTSQVVRIDRVFDQRMGVGRLGQEGCKREPRSSFLEAAGAGASVPDAFVGGRHIEHTKCVRSRSSSRGWLPVALGMSPD